MNTILEIVAGLLFLVGVTCLGLAFTQRVSTFKAIAAGVALIIAAVVVLPGDDTHVRLPENYRK
jgi:hypothetical protein